MGMRWSSVDVSRPIRIGLNCEEDEENGEDDEEEAENSRSVWRGEGGHRRAGLEPGACDAASGTLAWRK